MKRKMELQFSVESLIGRMYLIWLSVLTMIYHLEGQPVTKYISLNLHFLLLSDCLNIKRRKSCSASTQLDAAQERQGHSFPELKYQQSRGTYHGKCGGGHTWISEYWLHRLLTLAAPQLGWTLVLAASEARGLHSGMEEETCPPFSLV